MKTSVFLLMIFGLTSLVLNLDFITGITKKIEKNRITELSGECILTNDLQPIVLSNEQLKVVQVSSDKIVGFKKDRVGVSCNKNKITYYKKLPATFFSELE